MKSRVCLVIVAAGGLVGCGDAQDRHRNQLKSQGYVDVHVLVSDRGFTFDGTKEGQRCFGTIEGIFSKRTETCESYDVACHRDTGLDHLDMLRAGCNAKVLSCCVNHGTASMDQDQYADAFTDFQTACDGGNAWGCNDLGVEYQEGKGTGRNLTKAYEAFKKACDIGGVQAPCATMANMLESGEGVAKDLPKARAVFQTACDAHLQAGCLGVAMMLVLGEGGAEDKVQGKAVLVKQCEDGGANACGLLVTYLRKDILPDPDRHFGAWAEKGCEAGSGAACIELGTAYEFGLRGQEKDAVKAVLRYTAACRMDFAIGCTFAAKLAKSGAAGPVKPERLAATFKKGCDLGDSEACDALH
jgi:TPR repeat protein